MGLFADQTHDKRIHHLEKLVANLLVGRTVLIETNAGDFSGVVDKSMSYDKFKVVSNSGIIFRVGFEQILQVAPIGD